MAVVVSEGRQGSGAAANGQAIGHFSFSGVISSASAYVGAGSAPTPTCVAGDGGSDTSWGNFICMVVFAWAIETALASFLRFLYRWWAGPRPTQHEDTESECPDEEEDEQGQWDDCRDHDRDPPAPDLQPDAMPTSDALGPETLEPWRYPPSSLLGAPATGSGILICEKTHVFHNMGNKCQFVCRSGSMTFKRQCKECKRIEAKARLLLS